MHPFFDRLAPTLHIAHRGGATLAPENTMEAFHQAVSVWRTDMLELDVRATADGEIVVFHDDTVARCTNGEGPIEGMTWDQVRSLDAGFRFRSMTGEAPFAGKGCTVPLLAEVLSSFPECPLNIELKTDDPQLLAGFRAVIRQHKATDRICVGSELDAVADALQTSLPECAHFYSRTPLTAFVMAVMTGQEPPLKAGAHVLDMPMHFQGTNLITPALLTRAREASLWVNVWTIDELSDMQSLIAMEVGGVMTDRPDLLRAALS